MYVFLIKRKKKLPDVIDTHEVTLTSGDMLLYESSKCFHGRPRKFNGSWYTSVFVHYHPRFKWKDQGIDRYKEKSYAVPPPHWRDQPRTRREIPLEIVGTGFKEPTCPNEWCDTEHSIKWSGPGQEGYWIAPTGEKHRLDAKPLGCADWKRKCPEWSRRENECTRNANYMHLHCKKSCGLCSVEEVEEEDTETHVS